jgi:Domain of unknown function (DUF5666)
MTHTDSIKNALRRLATAGLLGALVLNVLLAGCGGGVGTGGTGTYASGPITGFGSVIVNGVRFDDTNASVLDDDGGGRDRAELKLGMTVDIDGGAITTTASGSSATASRIRFGSEIVGPVAAVDRVAGTLRVLGQTVQVAVETVFDDRLDGGLAAVRVGNIVEVYALYDAATGTYNATRIEPRATAAQWRVRGPIAALDAVGKTMRIGNANFTYAGATDVPVDLSVGAFVRLRLDLLPDASSRFVVRSFGVGVRPPEDRDEARLKGLVTALVSTASFNINGLPVDASGAAFPNGTAGLQLGARAEAEGPVVDGVLRARTVRIESDDDVRDRGFELKGRITSVDAAAQTFVLRGVTVSTARPDLELEGGTLADLTPGREVEVKARLSADRTRLEATEIKFDD